MTNQLNLHAEVAIPITDTDYYYMIENQVRTLLPMYEVGHLLPAARKILRQASISEDELETYPIEGYYYKTVSLRQYFTILRNLQMNQKLFHRIQTNTAEFQVFAEVVDNDLFGQRRPYSLSGFENAPIKRRYDIVTLTMEDDKHFNVEAPRPWTIDSIMATCAHHVKRQPNLVELAWMTKNPKCVCAGAETNIAYRMYATISGCSILTAPEYVWAVSPEVEDFGEQVVDAYQSLFGMPIEHPTIFNHSRFKKTPELPRVAHLGTVVLTGEHYHWILNTDGDLEDRYDSRLLTTEMFTNGQNTKS